MSFSTLKLKDTLIENPEYILDLLRFINIEDFIYNDRRNEVRFNKETGSNLTTVLLNLNTLQYKDFSSGEHGDIFTLIIKSADLSIRYQVSV